ncbi:MAG: DUF2029 domain-containing protein [Alphaproteobacteria bacterium]|nr:DUF2029 domain-containing protein [Alphaproteobacteria bacterium]
MTRHGPGPGLPANAPELGEVATADGLVRWVAAPGRITIPLIYAPAVLFAASVLLIKSVFSTDPEIDFKYLWTAGTAWNQGLNPYQDEFRAIGASLFPNANVIKSWVYPPNWWPVTAGLALLPHDVALAAWRTFGAACLVWSAWLIYGVIRTLRANIGFGAFIIVFAYLALMQDTAITLALGQTSLIVALGAALFISGVARGANWRQILGLTILVLKPQLGFVVCAGFFMMPAFRRNILIAAVVTCIAAAPALIIGGVGESLRGLMDGLRAYATFHENGPWEASGIRNPVHLLLGVEVSSFPLMAAAMAMAAGLGWRIASGPRAGETAARVEAMVYFILISLAVTSLHTYDFVAAAAVFVIAFTTDRRPALIATPLFLLALFRAANVAQATGIMHPGGVYFVGSLIVSAAAAAYLGVVMWASRAGRAPIIAAGNVD